MNKVKCDYCGAFEEPVVQGSSYFCALCSARFEIEQILDANSPDEEDYLDDDFDEDLDDDFNVDEEVESFSSEPNYINATCPICQNDNGNTLVDGQCRCSLCGTKFNIPTYNNNNYSNNTYNNAYNNTSTADMNKRRRLEEKRDSHLKWGIVFLIFFWPVGLYKLYQWYQVNQELKNMK